MVNGQFSSFDGLEAQISTSSGELRIPAAVALKLARASAVGAPECQAEVPVAAVMAGMEVVKTLEVQPWAIAMRYHEIPKWILKISSDYAFVMGNK